MGNHLHSETSRHLLQHEDQPVNWYPWGETALALAASQNKPILLSIGFSACHWCHAMATESFADPAIAAKMNERFINIKVDREERPDLDDIYQTAHQLLTGHTGGWPLTVFLCPKTRVPFIAGGYYPKESNDSQIGFDELLDKVHQFYHDFSKNFVVLRDQVQQGFDRLAQPLTLDKTYRLKHEPIIRGARGLMRLADTEHGGFGGAPKFAMPAQLERLYLLANSELACSGDAEQQLALTLSAMAKGGIADPVSGGFFRYATDADWQIPHFEKLLCDNGQLLGLYAKGWDQFGNVQYAQAAEHIATWAMRDMQSPDGGFYSSVDADYQGLEGAYYVFAQAQLQRALSTDDYPLAALLFGWKGTPNYAGHWHLHQPQPWQAVAEHEGMRETELADHFTRICHRLYLERTRLPAPGKDEKIRTAWNGLMIKGLASAARYVDKVPHMANGFSDSCLHSAQRAVDFIRQHLWVNNRLFATWQAGRPTVSGFADDYVYLMSALLDMLQREWRDSDYRFLISLAESLLVNLEDAEEGGFFYTAHDHEPLIYRAKPWADGVLPSVNGLAAGVFLRLGHLTAEPRYIDAAQCTIEAGWIELERQPELHHSLLVALDNLLKPPVQVLLYGDAAMAPWQQVITEQFSENVWCYRIPVGAVVCPPEVMAMDENSGLICEGDKCLPEQHSLDALLQQLETCFCPLSTDDAPAVQAYSQ